MKTKEEFGYTFVSLILAVIGISSLYQSMSPHYLLQYSPYNMGKLSKSFNITVPSTFDRAWF